MKRAIFTSLGWVLANALLFAIIFSLETNLNFFDWHPKWTIQVIGCVTSIVAVAALLFYLARTTKDKSALVISLIACVALVAMVILAVSPEPSSTGWFSRSRSSPAWYRWGRVLLGCIPITFWCSALTCLNKNETGA